MSEQVQHTPGPWRCAARRDENDPRWALQPGVVREMVEVLEALVRASYDITPASAMDELWRQAERVLAKVRGNA